MANRRPIPSGCMIDAPVGVPGAALPKSGISLPVHLLPFHWISIRFGSHGLPLISAEARLYSTRRLSGHAQAHPSVFPRPDGSELSRLAIWLPCSVQLPVSIQQEDAVVPSSRR